MDKNQTYTLSEAHLYFAKSLNNIVWELLQKPIRSKAEDEIMEYAAHASCFHWLQVGTGLHHQRGEWLIAHVYTELLQAEAALRHAARCLELSHEFSTLMEDFDWAYAYEGMARASALAGKRDEALDFIQRAAKQGQAIKIDEDRTIFLGDFNGGDWHGIRPTG